MKIFLLIMLMAAPGPDVRPPAATRNNTPASIQELSYVDDENPRHRLTLFLPSRGGEDEPLPLVIYIHGGGWRSGSHQSGASMLRKLVSTGQYAGASIGYRLTGEAQWPAQIHDCKAALRWLRANAPRWNVDPDRIAVVGPSAGGHLAAMLGTSAGVESMQGDLGAHDEVEDHVTCVVDLFGATDLLQMDAHAPAGARLKHDAPRSPESLLLGAPLQSVPEKAATANPITYVTPDDPPFLIIHGSADAVVPYHQSVILDAALEKKGVDSIFITIQEGGHGGQGIEELQPRIRAFLERHLHGAKVEIPDTPIKSTPRKPSDRRNRPSGR